MGSTGRYNNHPFGKYIPFTNNYPYTTICIHVPVSSPLGVTFLVIKQPAGKDGWSHSRLFGATQSKGPCTATLTVLGCPNDGYQKCKGNQVWLVIKREKASIVDRAINHPSMADFPALSMFESRWRYVNMAVLCSFSGNQMMTSNGIPRHLSAGKFFRDPDA